LQAVCGTGGCQPWHQPPSDESASGGVQHSLYSSDDEGTAPGSISGRPPFAPLLLPLPPQAVVVVVVVVVARRGRPPPPPTAKAGGGGGARSLRNVAQPYIMAEPLLEMFIKSVCALILSARQLL